MVPLYDVPYHMNNFVNIRRKNMIMCANCGGLGHIYRTCNHPTISYGFICYKIINKKPMYLMVQRKDSLSYVEFMRGKYELENKQYIMRLFSNMTEEERNRLRRNNFVELWNEMWCKGDELGTKNFNKEFVEAQEKFSLINKGYYIKSSDKLALININYMLENTKSEYEETEWGFPKGRRNVNENDICCALREFTEETGFNSESLALCWHMKPYEEIFSGTNKKRYKHVYYIAEYIGYDDNQSNPSCKEIKNVKWFNYEDSQDKIRDINIERKELLKRLNQIILKNL